MQRRPIPLIVLAVIYGMIAVSMPVQAMAIYGHSLSELSSALDKLTWLNWLLLTALVGSAFLLWQASPKARVAVIVASALMLFNNLVVGLYATDFSLTLTTLASFGFILVNLPLLRADIRALLRQPERRWWRRAERKRVSVPVFIDAVRAESVRTDTFDLSETGVFIPDMQNVKVGDWVTIRMLTFGAFHPIRCQAKVVRQNEARGAYPAGIGMQFMDLSRRQKRDLRRFLARRDFGATTIDA